MTGSRSPAKGPENPDTTAQPCPPRGSFADYSSIKDGVLGKWKALFASDGFLRP